MNKEEMLMEKLTGLAAQLQVSTREVLSRCRRAELVDARCLVAAAMKQQAGVRQMDIALLLGISQAAVSKLLVRHRDLLRFNKDYREKWESLGI